jgi:hypothetical protein
MPVSVLTSRVLDGDGRVTAVAVRPFLVLDPGEDVREAERELQQVIGELEELAKELEAARDDEHHPRHRWWLP